MVSDEIENNRDYYQNWKPRFFDKTGAPTEELKFYVQDAIEAEHASKNQSFKELDDAYNRAWKNTINYVDKRWTSWLVDTRMST